ncbi:dynamin-related protein 3A-like isoform X2 [Coffea arabica]|uniref:Dynamin-related protein 3A-like isoform X2 n=1 Tax=Coffea arabica TaxID=13443 RepID=A0A6P6TS84_COFAR|nr:dynamin-related protein 3A-like isoform X2 [Coffea arabica]
MGRKKIVTTVEQVSDVDDGVLLPDYNQPPPPTPFIGGSVIPIVNKLQDIFASLGKDQQEQLSKLKLPQVAVVGGQSSGKSSVLEALVRRDFLPRGCDICTRCPLVLQLENRPSLPGDEDDGLEWGEFRHLPGRKFYDFSEICREIQVETEREAGLNKGVSDKEIRLKVSSPNVLNITLIDLPGITKVPVGDQPNDIEARIREIINSYIRQETCIILAVTPANSDLATSDALKMAREVDPAGSRTIGVITKLDIMDRGTDARKFLLGTIIPLRLGYVGVINRSQEDINKNRSIASALAYEEQFFRDNPVYNGLKNSCGIQHLARKLNQVLEQHIRVVLPNLRKELNNQFVTVAKEGHALGEVMESKTEQGAILLNILTKYCEAFSAMVDGKSENLSTTELSGGARIHYIFQSIFVKSLEMSHDCEPEEVKRFPRLRRQLEDVTLKFLHDGSKPAERMITNMIEMEMGYINSSHPNFIGGKRALEIAVEHVRASQDGRDVQSNASEMGQMSQSNPSRSDIGAFPNQAGQPQSNGERTASIGNSTTRTWGISSIFGSRLTSGETSSSREPGKTMHDINQAPSIIHLTEPPSLLRPLERGTEYQTEIIVMKLLLQSYYDIVRKNVQDLVPKAIMHFLVNDIRRDLLGIFIKKLYRESLFEELLWEHDDDVLKRKQTGEMFLILQQAIQTLDKVVADVSSTTPSSDTNDASILPRFH